MKELKHSFNKIPISVVSEDADIGAFYIYDADPFEDLAPQIIRCMEHAKNREDHNNQMLSKELSPEFMGLVEVSQEQLLGKNLES